MGSNVKCCRRHCAHQLTEHRRAQIDSGPDRGRLIVGACHHPGCECAQYVEEGLTTGNRLSTITADVGRAATSDLLFPGLPGDPNDPFYDRFLIVPNGERYRR